MDSLPDELVLHVATFAEPVDIVSLQAVSRRFLRILRDDRLWRTICYQHSPAEAINRRQRLLRRMSPHMAELATAVQEGRARLILRSRASSNSGPVAHSLAFARRGRALASWDPSYPEEKINFYEEFVARHAPVQMGWLPPAYKGTGCGRAAAEAIGLGVYYDQSTEVASKIYAPLDDGSIGVWCIDAGARGGRLARQGAMLGTSEPGLLVGNGVLSKHNAVVTETGVVDCVCIDNRQNRGHFAALNVLKEIDLETLQVVCESEYPVPITALSEAQHPTPVTVGTNLTVHLHDPRQRHLPVVSEVPSRCERTAGTLPNGHVHDVLHRGIIPRKHAVLSQPGPLSIVHLPNGGCSNDGNIWVAGRFTSLLNYDRRFFPRLRGTVHSGARVSSMTVVHQPLVPRSLGLHSGGYMASGAQRRPSQPVAGHTIVAAGGYQGKGSLELFGLVPDRGQAITPSGACMRNRQTASASKLLSVTTHGARLAYSDADGNIKWIERDGFTPVRSFNINDDAAAAAAARPGALGVRSLISSQHRHQQPTDGDIVQKLVPVLRPGQIDDAHYQHGLVLWTGDGRIGLLTFGASCLPELRTGSEGEYQPGMAMEDAEELTMRHREREYGRTIRQALERQAADVRFVRGLGMGLDG